MAVKKRKKHGMEQSKARVSEARASAIEKSKKDTKKAKGGKKEGIRASERLKARKGGTVSVCTT